MEALDLFDALLDDPRFHLRMLLEPGDLQFCYNHTLLHDRCAFEDWPEVERRRQLFRLWLSPPDDRPLPASFAARFGTVEVRAASSVKLGIYRWFRTPADLACVPLT